MTNAGTFRGRGLLVCRERAELVGLSALYGIILNWYYPRLSQELRLPEYPYNPPNWDLWLLSWCLYLSPAFWMPTHLTKPSQGIVWILYIFLFAPTIFIPNFVLQMEVNSIAFYNLYIYLMFNTIITATYMRTVQVVSLRVSPLLYLFSIVLLFMLLVSAVVYSFGFQFRIVSIYDVYDVRSEYKVKLQELGSLVAYIVPTVSNGLASLLGALGIFLSRTRWRRAAFVLIIMSIFTQLYVFTLAGFKTALFSVLAVWFVFLLMGNRNPIRLLIISILCFYSISYLIFLLGDNLLFLGIVRRVFIIPGIQSSYYYEYFSQNPPVLLGHSILEGFSERPQTPPAYIIGYAYYGSLETSANANFWADGFANFRFVGVLIATLMLAVLLWVVDAVSSKHSLRLTLPALTPATYTLTNSALTTSLSTHGLLLTLLLLWLAPPFRERGPLRGS